MYPPMFSRQKEYTYTVIARTTVISMLYCYCMTEK